MIDGFKTISKDFDFMKWLNNPLLNFNIHHTVNLGSGAVLSSTHFAYYKGLKFVITPSNKNEYGHTCTVIGSLHKYYNNGIHNANDFTFDNIQEVIQELQDKFDIDLSKAMFRSIESGLNIPVPDTAKKVIGNVLAHKEKSFDIYSVKGSKAGKQIDRQQYSVKVYDKGNQYKKITKSDSLVRFEIRVNKMVFLKKYGITCLADLQDLAKVNSLKDLILDCWNDTIYHDRKNIRYREMKNNEQKKFLNFGDARVWDGMDKKQRSTQKKYLRNLVLKYGNIDTQAEISKVISDKWDQLATAKCVPNISNPKPLIQVNEIPFTKETESKKGIGLTKDQEKETPPKSNRKCTTCDVDISHKSKQAVYCSKRCNNVQHARKRKIKRQQQKQFQSKQLDIFLNGLHKSNLQLLIYTKNDSKEIGQHKIRMLPDEIRQVRKVVLSGSSPPIILTSHRAKKLIRSISLFNQDF